MTTAFLESAKGENDLRTSISIMLCGRARIPTCDPGSAVRHTTECAMELSSRDENILTANNQS